MKICVNGNPEEVMATSLDMLVEEFKLNATSLVVEHNGRIVKQEDWSTTMLREQDQLELLSFVGGG